MWKKVIRDFTINVYSEILSAFAASGYRFMTFEEYLSKKHENKFVILRHDVDKYPENSLRIALLEYSLSIKSTYYFRMVKSVFKNDIVKEISKMGHEIGYHYEDLALAGGDISSAIKNFRENLEKLRKIVPVVTICMHGSPMSKWDNRKLWEKFSFTDYGIIGEPYFSTDFTSVFYLTDTGRGWNKHNVSLRDEISKMQGPKIRSSYELVKMVINKELPNGIMINTHPQRWTNEVFPWLYELIWQKTKNIIKAVLKN